MTIRVNLNVDGLVGYEIDSSGELYSRARQAWVSAATAKVYAQRVDINLSDLVRKYFYQDCRPNYASINARPDSLNIDNVDHDDLFVAALHFRWLRLNINDRDKTVVTEYITDKFISTGCTEIHPDVIEFITRITCMIVIDDTVILNRELLGRLLWIGNFDNQSDRRIAQDFHNRAGYVLPNVMQHPHLAKRLLPYLHDVIPTEITNKEIIPMNTPTLVIPMHPGCIDPLTFPPTSPCSISLDKFLTLVGVAVDVRLRLRADATVYDSLTLPKAICKIFNATGIRNIQGTVIDFITWVVLLDLETPDKNINHDLFLWVDNLVDTAKDQTLLPVSQNTTNMYIDAANQAAWATELLKHTGQVRVEPSASASIPQKEPVPAVVHGVHMSEAIVREQQKTQLIELAGVVLLDLFHTYRNRDGIESALRTIQATHTRPQPNGPIFREVGGIEVLYGVYQYEFLTRTPAFMDGKLPVTTVHKLVADGLHTAFEKYEEPKRDVVSSNIHIGELMAYAKKYPLVCMELVLSLEAGITKLKSELGALVDTPVTLPKLPAQQDQPPPLTIHVNSKLTATWRQVSPDMLKIVHALKAASDADFSNRTVNQPLEQSLTSLRTIIGDMIANG